MKGSKYGVVKDMFIKHHDPIHSYSFPGMVIIISNSRHEVDIARLSLRICYNLLNQQQNMAFV